MPSYEELGTVEVLTMTGAAAVEHLRRAVAMPGEYSIAAVVQYLDIIERVQRLSVAFVCVKPKRDCTDPLDEPASAVLDQYS